MTSSQLVPDAASPRDHTMAVADASSYEVALFDAACGPEAGGACYPTRWSIDVSAQSGSIVVAVTTSEAVKGVAAATSWAS